MPTYTYRCRECQQEQTLSHGMLEQPTPVCTACGHFCEKMIGAPTILSGTTAEVEPTRESAHDCGASCALHRPLPNTNASRQDSRGD